VNNFETGEILRTRSLIRLIRFKVSMIVILSVKAKFLTTASSRDVSSNKCDADEGQPEINMAAETGNAITSLLNLQL